MDVWIVENIGGCELEKDNRRILTWSLNAGSETYMKDLEMYYHKIYTIGLHEFGVSANGKIYDFRSEQYYFDSSGNHTGARMPEIIEEDMVNYPSIKWMAQIVLFGWNKVQPFLDNNVLNSEGRYPQDQFLFEMNKVLDIYEYKYNTTIPLNLAGVEMDMEASMTEDPYSQGYDVKYVAFLERFKNELLIPRTMKLRVNAYAMWGAGVPHYYRFHNYEMFANSADKTGNATIDEIQLMTYDFAWAGSSAGASTPVWWFREVGDWCLQCFDTRFNPNAKLTIDNLFFGSAGYGHRWGMYDQDAVKSGSVITYRNLLGWQNGLYRHYHADDSTGETVYHYHDQEFLYQASIQDEESKNEIMYPHVYDMFHPKYMDVKEQDGGIPTATIGNYNLLDYGASNFKMQIPEWDNVVAIVQEPTSYSGKAFPSSVAKEVREEASRQGIDVIHMPIEERQKQDTNMDMDSIEFNHLIKTVDDVDYPFAGWFTEQRNYQEGYVYDSNGNVTSAVCTLESTPDGRINYEINVPQAGNYKLVAITNFSWYSQAKIGGYLNDVTKFNIGGADIPEWYPFFMKGAHFYDVGAFDFNAGTNTISIYGELSDPNTPIYGFVVCSDFDQNFSGGELTAHANIQPMIDKDGSELAIPTTFAMASKMLRRDSRPAILWDDEFRTYNEGTVVSDSSYYQKTVEDFKVEGGGDYVAQDGTTSSGQPIFKCYSDPEDIGFTTGTWSQKNYALHYDSSSAGQIVLSRKWTVNLSIEERIRLVRADGAVGVRFYAQEDGSAGDGYLFLVDIKNGVKRLVFENNGNITEIASQPLGNISEGDTVEFKTLLHNGKGLFYLNGVQAFVEASGNPVTGNADVDKSTGEVTLNRNSGAVGIYADNAEIYCYHLGIGTTDRWETLEKFEVSIDGTTKKFGEVARTGYEYDDFGYLIYSGLDEVSTRDAGQGEDSYAMSLDYEVHVFDWVGWQGAKDVKIKLRDAGVWFGELLIGDREGMSIIWAGDAHSFLASMNMAVNEYGAKGIGLWTMGQEDPFLFEMVPDVVPRLNSGG